MDVMDSTNPGISLKSLCAGVLLEPLNEAEVEVAENKVRLLQDIIDKYEEEIKGMKKEIEICEDEINELNKVIITYYRNNFKNF